MFNPKSHRKRLGLHQNLMFMKHGKGIPCTMANGQNQCFTWDLFGMIYTDTDKLLIFDFQIGNLTSKTYFSSKRKNLLSNMFYYISKYIRSDMWFIHI